VRDGYQSVTRTFDPRSNLLMKTQSDRLLSVFDYAGTFVFAAEGALAGIAARLDLFGLMVLSFVTALGGGIIRDLLLGATPPVAIRNWRYPAVAFAAGTLVFISNQFARQIPSGVTIALDAGGLALFAIAAPRKRSWPTCPLLLPLSSGPSPAPVAASYGTCSLPKSPSC
jgi:hypothetical protein